MAQLRATHSPKVAASSGGATSRENELGSPKQSKRFRFDSPLLLLLPLIRSSSSSPLVVSLLFSLAAICLLSVFYQGPQHFQAQVRLSEMSATRTPAAADAGDQGGSVRDEEGANGGGKEAARNGAYKEYLDTIHAKDWDLTNASDIVQQLHRMVVLQREELQAQKLLLRAHREQISELQGAVLDSKKGGSSSSSRLPQDARDSAAMGAGGFRISDRMCAKEAKIQQREEQRRSRGKKLAWRPEGKKFLLATCVFGRLSNRLQCMRNYMLAATILQRTLIVPMEDLYPGLRRWNSKTEDAYRFDIVFNVSKTRECLGRNTVVTLTEYLEAKNITQLKVLRLLCWAPRCKFFLNLPKDPRLAFPRLEQAALEPNVSMAKFLQELGTVSQNVITLGDIYSSHASFIDPPWGFLEGLALGWQFSSKSPPSFCRALMLPHAAVTAAADGFISETTGLNFASLHLRRDDFFRHCLRNNKCLYWPLRQVAECVVRKMRLANLRLLFLLSDMLPEDFELFKSLLSFRDGDWDGFSVSVLRLPSLSGKMWAEDLNRAFLDQVPLAVATVEKLVAARSAQFLFTPGSTFSRHIQSMRVVGGVPTCLDAAFCDGIAKPETLGLV